jgi:hypothetical protein
MKHAVPYVVKVFRKFLASEVNKREAGREPARDRQRMWHGEEVAWRWAQREWNGERGAETAKSL